MKRRFFSTVLIAVLCVFALNVKGEVNWETHPVITSFPLEFNKYIDIVSGEVSWYHGDTASVYVSADLNGVGEGVATLKNVYLMGEKKIVTYGGTPAYFGIKNPDGSWQNVSANVSVGKKVKISENAKDGDSWSWGAGELSEIRPTPWGWKETTSQGFTISFPAGITGRFSTTGGWAAGSAQPERTAPARSGTHTLEVRYKCSKCQKYDDSVAALGGKSAHEKITCPAPNCSVQYHKCSPPSGHAVCSACGDRKCDGDDHSYVKQCTGKWFHGPANEPSVKLSGCGQSIYKCTESDHNRITLDCGHSELACMRDSHTCPVTDDTPNCQDCTSHCSSPCSCTNSGTCNGTVAAPPPPEPEPTLVACGRSACTASVSSSTEHESSPCSPSAGHTYYTCNPNVNVSNWLNKHRVRTCRYSECGRSWQQCVTGTTPVCNKPYRQQNGLKCWAIE